MMGNVYSRVLVNTIFTLMAVPTCTGSVKARPVVKSTIVITIKMLVCTTSSELTVTLNRKTRAALTHI